MRPALLRTMRSQPRELPMAPAGCTLDQGRLGEQLDRYQRLGRAAVSIHDGDAQLVITFGADLDSALLRETIAIERDCCSFLAIDYDESQRRLTIGIDDPAHDAALAALRSALRDPTRAETSSSR